MKFRRRPATLQLFEPHLARIRIPSAADTGSAAPSKKIYYFASLDAGSKQPPPPPAALTQHLREVRNHRTADW